ncbi:MAG TPA: hypothetical protein VIC85_22210 [Ktedonobacterales bacterium]
MMTQPPRINHRPPLVRLTNDTRALAERMGSETTAALVRAAAGVRVTTETVASAAAEGAGTLGRTAGEGIAGGVRAAAFPSVGARGAFRMGRFVGRIEGAVKLALFALRRWRRRANRRQVAARDAQRARSRLLTLARWGPSIIAMGWMAARLIRRLVPHRGES